MDDLSGAQESYFLSQGVLAFAGQTMEAPGQAASESSAWSHRRDVPLCEAGPGLGGDPIILSVRNSPVYNHTGDNAHTAPG